MFCPGKKFVIMYLLAALVLVCVDGMVMSYVVHTGQGNVREKQLFLKVYPNMHSFIVRQSSENCR